MSSAAAAAKAQRPLPNPPRCAGRGSLTPNRGVSGQAIACPRAISCSSKSGMSRLLDLRPQPRQRARQARLDRAFGDAERRGGLLDVQIQEVAARDHEPVVLAERTDGLEQPPALVARAGHPLGGWGRLPQAEALGEAELQAVPPSGRPQAVASLVGHDPQQPGPELTAGAEPI